MGLLAPTYGIDADANTDDSYYEVIAVQAADIDCYDYITTWVTTYDAIISLDGGTTDHIYLKAGQAPLTIRFAKRTGAIHAKNATATEDYTALVVNIGFEGR